MKRNQPRSKPARKAKPKTIDEYLAALSSDKRAALEATGEKGGW